MKNSIHKWSAFFLAVVLSLTMFEGRSFETKAEAENKIANPVFAQEDVSMWQADKGNATISAVTMEAPIFDDVTTCGKISGRTSPYDCIAQDVTGILEDGTEYIYSFYAMLSEDYENAPANQRVLEFAPYVTVDGQTTYMGSYSAEIQGTASQTLQPGVWTKYEGVFRLNSGKAPEKVVIRLLEQGTDYGQGECVLGDYFVTGVTLREVEKPPVELEDVPALRDIVESETDKDFIIGTAIDTADINDEYVMALVNKHFNAVTLGNALKPDALFGYSNSQCPGKEEVVFNGEKMTVPVLDYSRAEKLLDVILKWNQKNPDKKIRVRGHVLVWHSQTPEWFFHEDYEASKAYVSKEEMNKRLEWYIATVLGHFTGDDSPYKDMFYGWDVVNEAVSDNGGKYRTDEENPNEPLTNATHGNNSSWWHVYGSNEYIINAFKYANKYAPAELELYYNDYNECDMMKKNGIVKLINEVKAAKGTRLDGFGMQGHYMLNNPDANYVGGFILEYARAAGKVQITELDVKASDSYDGTEATEADEYRRQGLYYLRLYNTIKAARKQGLEVDGITVWGVVDKYSWLQTSSSVGGGASGRKKQCPLLFDDDYKVKPAYWAFVDPTMLSAKNQPTSQPTAEPTKEPQATAIPEPEATETVTASPKETPVPETQSGEEKAGALPVWLVAVVVIVAVVILITLCIVLSGKKKKGKVSEKKEEPKATEDKQ